jgi:glutamine amidotransferase
MTPSNRKICIIDYGSGNVQSVFNIFRSVHDQVKVSNDAEDINAATHIVLPGVGAFAASMSKIMALSSLEVLKDNVLNQGKPYLGICVGMQVLADQGMEHGLSKGLGWIPGVVKKINAPDLHLPHVGWNNFSWCLKDHPLLKGIGLSMDFYYVHSFQFENAVPSDCAAKCNYGMEFTSVISRGNIHGVQFHPEKSQKAGKKLIENFLEL